MSKAEDIRARREAQKPAQSAGTTQKTAPPRAFNGYNLPSSGTNGDFANLDKAYGGDGTERKPIIYVFTAADTLVQLPVLAGAMVWLYVA